MKILKTATFTAAFFILSAPAISGDFDEFDHSTVNFDKLHKFRMGTSICAEQESVDHGAIVPMSKCYRLDRDMLVKVDFVIHGITQPQFFVEPADAKLKHGWVYRSAIVD